ncbi:cell wall-binding repeat-containing protein [Clostridium nigeriense]|uniref:cell wall-binding repeat-containing protein n=1 Tax=Clostridium nigeriense TaxID=1805470 RepID=UPI003D33AFFA
MKSSKKSLKLIAIMLLLTVFNFVLPTYDYIAKADTQSNSEIVEAMLKEIINEYGEDNIIFDDGIVLEESQEISLSDLSNELSINWKSRDNSVVEVTNDKVKGISYGTTFLIGEENGKYHVRQVYVSSTVMNARSSVSNYNADNARKGQYVVYLDPGHGGSDPGASGNGLVEKELNLKIALGVRDKLQSMGIVVYMSRDTDKFVSLEDIASGANAVNPDIFISIHQNSFTSSSAYGIETYWYKGNADKSLATLLQNNLINNTNGYNRGVKNEAFYVIKNTNMPSSLIECGFITNPDEASKLKTSDYQNKIINAIANGANDYLKANINLDSLVAERIYGSTRYETSYNLFDKGWSSSDTVILASGVDYPDALTATPLAGKYNAPILLSRNTTLDSQPELKSTLINKGVKNVIIIGGQTAIPQVIQDQISALGISVRRIGGSDRYETSALIAKEVGVNNGEVALAYGLSFADGLSIASVAASKQMPILLTRTDSIPNATANFINNNNIKKTYVVGSTTVISNSVVSQTQNPERLGGLNRYETNSIIFNKFKSEIDLNTIYIASGLAFPDALSSSALAAKNGNFVLLSNIRQVEGTVKNIISEIKPSLNNVYVLGSNVVISDNILYGLGIDSIR